jgi:hypothetical protein
VAYPIFALEQDRPRRTAPLLPFGGQRDPKADQDAAGPAHETARQYRPSEHAAGAGQDKGYRARDANPSAANVTPSSAGRKGESPAGMN